MDVSIAPEMKEKLGSVDYQTDPSKYRHWRLSFDPPVATLTMDVAEDGGLRPGYKLKLNSYDLGVDIELHDALQRIRFEHPEIRSVVVTSGFSIATAPVWVSRTSLQMPVSRPRIVGIQLRLI